MRDTIGRMLLAGLGGAAVVAGILALLGVRHLESRTETVIVGIGAIGNGVFVVRFALAGWKRAA